MQADDAGKIARIFLRQGGCFHLRAGSQCLLCQQGHVLFGDSQPGVVQQQLLFFAQLVRVQRFRLHRGQRGRRAGRGRRVQELFAKGSRRVQMQMGGIVRLTGFILRITALFELAGAALLLPTFCADYGLRGIWYALFHSISAFCNAGFDLLGTEEAKFVSLTRYAGNPLLTTVIAALIVFGGLGFLTWEDICTYRLDFHRYRMQSKVILVTTAFLLVLPTLYFYCFEFTAGSAWQRILLSMFQSVTPRTAGFNTADLAAMGSTSQALMVVLMLLGGSPGSTAGGMKTTTFAVLLANMWATFRRREDAEFFGRRIDSSAVKNAATIAGMYLTLFFLGAFVIATAEQLPMSVCLYETASAVATVGLTLGITPQLGILSQGVLIALMFLGRVGGLTLIYAAFGSSPAHSRLPQEKIAIG